MPSLGTFWLLRDPPSRWKRSRGLGMPNKTVGLVRRLVEERHVPRAASHNETAIDRPCSFVGLRVSLSSQNQEERRISRASSDVHPIAFAIANLPHPAQQ